MDFTLTSEQKRNVSGAITQRMRQIRAESADPVASNMRQVQVINDSYRMLPDGVDASTGHSVSTVLSPVYNNAIRVIDTANVIDVPYTVLDATNVQNKEDMKEAQRMVPPVERAKATKATVDEKVQGYPVGEASFVDAIRRFMTGKAPETTEARQARQQAAQSPRTDVRPEVKRVMYAKDCCTSQGQDINYKVTMAKVDWGRAIKDTSKSPAEAIEHLVSYLTNAVRDNYGGWGRITEIIVRDQQLIINRSCYRPIIDPKTVDAGVFPLDTLDYLREGAVASFFDWSMLKHMRNLVILDVDDLGFYEIQIGGRLKCGRRIGVSTLFNLCPSLEMLILGGDAVSRDDLTTDKATPVKQKLATHKRFSLFSDGYKIEVCKNTNDFAGWTFGNMKNYACNRGNRGLFRYCCGLTARAGLAGVAGVVNLGTHLVGGIRDIFKEAMKPVDPSDVGLQ